MNWLLLDIFCFASVFFAFASLCTVFKKPKKAENVFDITTGCDKAVWYHMSGIIPINHLTLYKNGIKIRKYELAYHRIGENNMWVDDLGNVAKIDEARQAFKLMCRLIDEIKPQSIGNYLIYTLKLNEHPRNTQLTPR